MRAVIVTASVCVIVGLLIGPATAAAKSPTPVHFKESGEFTDPDYCGTGHAVDGDFDINGTNFLTPDQAVVFKQTAELKVDYTNPDNGQTVRLHTAGQFILEAVTTTPSGSVELITNKGLPEQIKSAHGKVLTRDAGYLQLLLTLDDSGHLVSSQVVIDRGPHPETEADMALFCQVTTTALGL